MSCVLNLFFIPSRLSPDYFSSSWEKSKYKYAYIFHHIGLETIYIIM